jgi:hypothetical protein
VDIYIKINRDRTIGSVQSHRLVLVLPALLGSPHIAHAQCSSFCTNEMHFLAHFFLSSAAALIVTMEMTFKRKCYFQLFLC